MAHTYLNDLQQDGRIIFPEDETPLLLYKSLDGVNL